MSRRRRRCRRRLAHTGWRYVMYVRDDGKTDVRLTCWTCGGTLGWIATLWRKHRGDAIYDEHGKLVAEHGEPVV